MLAVLRERENQQQAQRLENDYSSQGRPPDNLTHDPTQGQGTSAWQLSLRHSMEVNARNRRN